MFNLLEKFLDLSNHSDHKTELSYTSPTFKLSMYVNRVMFNDCNLIITNATSSLTLYPIAIKVDDTTVHITLKNEHLVSISFQLKSPLLQADLKKEIDYIAKLLA